MEFIDIDTEVLMRWFDKILPIIQVSLIVLGAYVIRALCKRLLHRIRDHYHISGQIVDGTYRFLSVLIYVSTFLLVLDRFGVSGTVLWTAFTGFAAVAAVAFFAAWSVLSNIFCAVLIVAARPFRLYDYIEILENGDKPGLKGQVIDINLIFSTLRERNDDGADTVLQVPNSLFFQRTLRRWRGNSTPYKKEKPPMADISLDFNPNLMGPLPQKTDKKVKPKSISSK